MPGVALATHLGLVGIEVRTQGTVLFAKFVRAENLLHWCSPFKPDCQENTAGLCRENTRHTAANQPHNQLARNSPEPGIVPKAVGAPSGSVKIKLLEEYLDKRGCHAVPDRPPRCN